MPIFRFQGSGWAIVKSDLDCLEPRTVGKRATFIRKKVTLIHRISQLKNPANLFSK
jgi:hypothetical protein